MQIINCDREVVYKVVLITAQSLYDSNTVENL